jgi:hypothetical protein
VRKWGDLPEKSTLQPQDGHAFLAETQGMAFNPGAVKHGETMMKWIGPALGGVASIIGIYAFVTGDMALGSKSDEAQTTTVERSLGSTPCVVADPTGTPLNVRAAPQGRVEHTLPDGVQVWRVNAAPDAREQEWAQVALSDVGGPVGWVFAAHLDCEPEAPESSPVSTN